MNEINQSQSGIKLSGLNYFSGSAIVIGYVALTLGVTIYSMRGIMPADSYGYLDFAAQVSEHGWQAALQQMPDKAPPVTGQTGIRQLVRKADREGLGERIVEEQPLFQRRRKHHHIRHKAALPQQTESLQGLPPHLHGPVQASPRPVPGKATAGGGKHHMPYPGHTEIPSAPAGGEQDLMPGLRGKGRQQRPQVPREGMVDEQDAHGCSGGDVERRGGHRAAPPGVRFNCWSFAG